MTEIYTQPPRPFRGWGPVLFVVGISGAVLLERLADVRYAAVVGLFGPHGVDVSVDCRGQRGACGIERFAMLVDFVAKIKRPSPLAAIRSSTPLGNAAMNGGASIA
jgi:hypothetical protein